MKSTESEKSIEKSRTDSESDSDLPMDPLNITEQSVSKYRNFVEYLIQRLSKEKEDKEEDVQILASRWLEILERGKQMVVEVHRRAKKVVSEMEWLEEQEDFKKPYLLRKTYLPQMLAQLRDINLGLGSSSAMAVVSDIKNRAKNVLSICLDELQDSKKELSEMMESIKLLKQVELDSQDEEDD